MRLSEHHEKLTKGIGKCSVPMWCNGLPAGFCDRPAYSLPIRKVGYYENGKFFLQYCPALVCPAHGGKEKPDNVILKMDGNQWCATYDDFINLQESPAGFGDTQDEAILNLIKENT